LNDLYRDYASKGVKFMFMNANQNEPAGAVQEHARSVGYVFPVSKDVGQALANRLGAQYTPEVFVLNGMGAVVYHGRIDDAENPARIRHNSLRLALDAVLEGRPVAMPEAKGFGCTIKRAQQKLSSIDEVGYRAMLKSNAGQLTLVDFWATWCAPCREEMPRLAELHGRLREKGFHLVTVSADDPGQQRAAVDFLIKSGIDGAAYLRRAKDDDKFINAVDPKWSGALPALFLYDRQGKLLQSFTGETDMGALEAAIRGALQPTSATR
jgi:thiol-disulfide isomerase/thioredoxin